MKRTNVILYLFMTILAGGILASNSCADGKDILLEISSTLSLSVPEQTALNVSINGEGAFGSTYFDVLSSTNNDNGYTLTMTTANTYLESETIDPNTSEKAKIQAIPYVSGGITADAFSASTDSNILNHWGISVDNTTSFNPIQLSAVIKETDTEATGDPTRINLGIKANTALIPATYTTKLNFQLVANVVEPDEGTEFLDDDDDPTKDSTHIDGRKNSVTYGGGTLARAFEVYYTNTLNKSMYIPVRDTETGNYTGEYKLATTGRDYAGIAASEYRFAIQDMVPEICANTTVVPSELQVLDLRDNKTYWISKLADGHCWMTQNLDLSLKRDKALTSNDTDLNVVGQNGYTEEFGYKTNNGVISWFPNWDVIVAKNVGTDGLIYGGYDYNNYWSAMSLDPGEFYQVDEYSVGHECNYLATPRSCTQYIVSSSSNKHRHIGDYYSWSAAIASNNSYSFQYDSKSYINANPQNSICPKGWRLPTVSSMDASEAGSTNEFDRLKYVYTEEGMNDEGVFNGPFYAVREGHVSGRDNQAYIYASGFQAEYWSSTVGGSSSAYYAYYASSGSYAYSQVKADLRSVRCVAR